MFLFIHWKVANDIINLIIILDSFFINDPSEVSHHKIRSSRPPCCWSRTFSQQEAGNLPPLPYLTDPSFIPFQQYNSAIITSAKGCAHCVFLVGSRESLTSPTAPGKSSVIKANLKQSKTAYIFDVVVLYFALAIYHYYRNSIVYSKVSSPDTSSQSFQETYVLVRARTFLKLHLVNCRVNTTTAKRSFGV